MRKIMLAAALASLLASAPARAEWTDVDTHGDARIAIDPDRVTMVYEHYHVWLRTTYSHPKDNGATLNYTQVSIDCETRTYKMLAVSDYDSSGNSIASMSDPDSVSTDGYGAIMPNTIMEAIANALC